MISHSVFEGLEERNLYIKYGNVSQVKIDIENKISFTAVIIEFLLQILQLFRVFVFKKCLDFISNVKYCSAFECRIYVL